MLRRLQVPSIVMKQTMIKKRTIIPIMIPKVTTSIYYNHFYYFNFVFRFSFFLFSFLVTHTHLGIGNC